MTKPLAPPPRKNPLKRTRLPVPPPDTRSRQAHLLTRAAADGTFVGERHDDPTGQLIDGAHRASLHRWWQAAKEEGVQAVATLKVGQGESAGELIDSLIALREEQDLEQAESEDTAP